jgi:hypothetical protein
MFKNYETTFTIRFRGKSKLDGFNQVGDVNMLSSLVASFIGAFKKLHPGIEVTPTQQTITSDNEIEVGQSVK